MIFFSLISTAFSSIFYGIIATVAIMAILYAVLRAINKSIVQTPVFYITGAILAILLLIQTSLLIGAMQAKGTADAAQEYVSGLIENYQGVVDSRESRQAIDALTDEFPIIGNFVDLTAFYGRSIADLPTSIHATVVDFLNSYIWRRIGWLLGILFVGCLIVIMFAKPNNEYGHRQIDGFASRHEGRRARTGSRQRVSRRR